MSKFLMKLRRSVIVIYELGATLLNISNAIIYFSISSIMKTQNK